MQWKKDKNLLKTISKFDIIELSKKRGEKNIWIVKVF